MLALALREDELLRGVKTVRMEQRTTEAAKKIIEEAAALLGVNGSEFTTQAAVRVARETLKDHGTTTLTRADQEAFARAIDNLEPNEALVAFVRHHKNR
jgi:uncharacterized protein (DUF1778 family)